MRLIKHRDGTVSVRMTPDQLRDIGFSATYAVSYWTNKVASDDTIVIDKEILSDFEALESEIGGFVSRTGS